MIASSGDALAGDGFVEAIKARLLPLVDCLTPNLAEAAALLGAPLAQDEAEMARQGAALRKLGPRAALMKGGHLAGAEAVDLLVTGDGVLRFAAPRLISRNLHGTGCTLSSAIAAHIVLGLELAEAIGQAKEFVRAAIGAGSGVKLGGGAGPLIQARLREGRRFSSPDAFS
jgi:hydroxymethylpyrimidine/phosphomethylpyrimidine kinase